MSMHYDEHCGIVSRSQLESTDKFDEALQVKVVNSTIYKIIEFHFIDGSSSLSNTSFKTNRATN